MPMLPKPQACTDCPLWGDGKGFVPDRLVGGSTVAFVLQNPGQQEEQGQRITGYLGGRPEFRSCPPQPLIGASGYAMEQTWLPKAGLQRDEVSYLNILKCRWTLRGKRTNKLPQGKEYQQAVQHCLAAHFRIPDSVTTLVACGDHAFKALGGAGLKQPDGKPATLGSYRGFLLPDKYDGRQVYCVNHPADALRDRSALLPMRLDYKRLGKLLAGEWPQPIPARTVFQTPEEVHACFDVLDTLSWVVVDTEFGRESKFLNLIGIGGWRDVPTDIRADGQSADSKGQIVGGQLEWHDSEAQQGTRQAFVRRYAALIQSVPTWFWNAKADLPVLLQNLHIGGHRFVDYCHFDDAMLLHHVLWSDQAHDLETVASLLGCYTKLKHLSREDPNLYNWGDVIETIQIVRTLKGQLRLDPRLDAVYERKRRLLPLIIERESTGLRVNQARVSRAIPEYQAKLAHCSDFALVYCGYPLNLLSPGKAGQLARYLNEVEGYDLESVAKDDISEVRRQLSSFDADREKKDFSLDYLFQRVDDGAHPLLELRALAARDSQILNHFLSTMEGLDRCYPQIQLHTQSSGRHSTVDPPLPTFPDDLQDVVLPEVGHIEWGYDWDQIELRIIAAEANDEPLLTAFSKSYDIHTLNACDIFSLRYPPDLVDPNRAAAGDDPLSAWQDTVRWQRKKDQRRRFAKVFVYRLLYGAKPETCTDIPGVVALGLDTRSLVRASENWLNRHPAIRAYQRKLAEQASKTGQVYSFGGRRRTLQETGDEAARQAMNHPMQGGCMDVYEEVMAEIDRQFYPRMKFRWGAHDSQKWDVSMCDFANSGVDADPMLQRAATLVQQPRQINGRQVTFPATFHVMYDDGRMEAWRG